jgi:hypothetical protein
MDIKPVIVNYDFDFNNICLIDVNSLIVMSSITTINNLNSYEIDCNLKNKACKRFIISDLIHAMCEALNNITTKNKVVFYFDLEDDYFGWFNTYFNKEELKDFFKKTLKIIGKNIPLRIFTGKVSFKYLIEGIDIKDEETIILLNEISLYVDKHRLRSITFSKARVFLDKYKLTFLSNKYFTSIKSKQLLYK